MGKKTEGKFGEVKELKTPQVDTFLVDVMQDSHCMLQITKANKAAAAKHMKKQVKQARARQLIGEKQGGGSKMEKSHTAPAPKKTDNTTHTSKRQRLKDGRGKAVRLEYSSEEENEPEPPPPPPKCKIDDDSDSDLE